MNRTRRATDCNPQAQFPHKDHILRIYLVVVVDVQSYSYSPRMPYQPTTSRIPSMRRAFDPDPGSGTPIYDALYNEYRRLFRALPGDRSGEEGLQFAGFHDWDSSSTTQFLYRRQRGGVSALPVPYGNRPGRR